MSMLNQRKRNTEMSKTKGKRMMMIKHKTSTHMGFPNHSFLWAQWTSEKLNLGTRKGGDGGMDGGRGTQQSKSNEQVKENGTNMTGHRQKVLSECLSCFSAISDLVELS